MARVATQHLHSGLVLYVHVPFCARVCSYCLLSARRTPARTGIAAYAEALTREVSLLAERTHHAPISTVHVGGGTPTLLSPDEIDLVFRSITERFARTPDASMGIEAHPATSTRARLDAFVRHGAERVSFGVETFTDDVLRAVNRTDQSLDDVRNAVTQARAAGFSAVNLDLLAGLPGETLDSFLRTVREALALEPDSLSVNRYLVEQSPLAAFGYAPDADACARTDAMLLAADEVIHRERPPTMPSTRLSAPAYGAQYVWDRSNRARSYFQQDMIGPATVLTLGHGALGHLHGGAFWTTAGTPNDYVRALRENRSPDVLVWPAPPRFEAAFYVMDRAARGTLSARAFANVFRVPMARVFGAELAYLVTQGLLTCEGDRWAKPPSRRFHALHLLCFLMGDEAPRATMPTPTMLHGSTLHIDDRTRDTDLTRALSDGASVHVTTTKPLSAERARALLRVVGTERAGARVSTDAGNHWLAQYHDVEAEFPPSLVWCRLAMRAVETARRLSNAPSERW
jgi:coproporphyrinogen III oxidase-like Fe-S oxidoreductase